MFQFPSGHSPLSSHKHLLGTIRARPANHKFEIEIRFDTNSTTFDKSKGKNIASVVNKSEQQTDGAEDPFPNNIMDRLVINSERMNNTTFYYALGFLREDLADLQLVPISSVCEFKKGFRHFDKIPNNFKRAEVDLEEEYVEQEEEPDDVGFKKVTMRFEGRNESKRKAAESTAAGVKQQDMESEAWSELCYFDYGLAKFNQEKNIILYKQAEKGSEIAK